MVGGHLVWLILSAIAYLLIGYTFWEAIYNQHRDELMGHQTPLILSLVFILLWPEILRRTLK